jgi:fumarylacetoacetate (FAA) hydrolase
MKFVNYLREGAIFDGGEPGVIVDDRIVSTALLQSEYSKATGKSSIWKGSTHWLIGRDEKSREHLQDAISWWVEAGRPESVKSSPLAGAKLLAPIAHPTSMRDAYAFRQHVEAARRNRGVEMIPEFDQFPVFYFTNHQAVIGPGPVEVMPEHLNRLDYELEAAIVISKAGKNIKASEADEYIGGYMVMNDWSARALQMEEMKLSLGPAKGKDFATSIGPWLVTRDELAPRRIPGEQGERYDLTMTASINGKEYSRGNLKDMTWTFAQIIERASYGVMLYPGDVIGSGTVGTGCLLELNGSKITDNLWLKVGDVVTCSIEMLGDLTNTVVAAKI